MSKQSRFWLDANVLIEANRRSYPYHIAKTFWIRLAEQVELGIVVSPRRVYQELTEHEKHQDFVKHWVKVRHKQLSQTASKEVSTLVGEIEAYIFGNPQFDQYESWKFSSGGDPWVIANAKVDGGTVVTQESALHPEAKKPRVPDVCKVFEVDCVNTLKMFEKLNVTF
jgi:hypothetical protein